MKMIKIFENIRIIYSGLQKNLNSRRYSLNNFLMTMAFWLTLYSKIYQRMFVVFFYVDRVWQN